MSATVFEHRVDVSLGAGASHVPQSVAGHFSPAPAADLSSLQRQGWWLR